MAKSPPPYVRCVDLLSRNDCRLLIVDMQERFMPTIPVAEQVTDNCVKLVKGAQQLGVPVAATEQYPKGLGSTVAPLAELLDRRPDKLRFSCAEVLNWGPAAEPADPDLTGRTKVVVAGIEAHVCVMQTVFDLLAAGYLVYVAADAVGSRRKPDWRFALERMAGCGAVITTTEAVLFEWCEVAGTEEFKHISNLVKGH